MPFAYPEDGAQQIAQPVFHRFFRQRRLRPFPDARCELRRQQVFPFQNGIGHEFQQRQPKQAPLSGEVVISERLELQADQFHVHALQQRRIGQQDAQSVHLPILGAFALVAGLLPSRRLDALAHAQLLQQHACVQAEP